MNQVFKKTLLAAACTAGMAATMQAEAANWLMLQGTEPADAAPRAKVWGFLQPTYRATKGTDLDAGPYTGQAAQFNRIDPHLSSNQEFSIHRARIGVRGIGFPLNSKVNYFFLAEFGSNGITWPGGGLGSAMITDASVTYNYIPGARIRAGLFKTPTAEEGLQAIHVFDYINFTNFSNQELLERFFNGDGTTGCTPKGCSTPNAPNGPVGAFRDIGVQIFDTFKTGGWNTSYAFMFGNGNGINRGNNNRSYDTYYYLSTEKVFAGKGPRVQSLKLFAWMQDGKRTLTTMGAGTYDRKRSGLGFTFRKAKYRAAGEYMMADGMIQNGTHAGAVVNSTSNDGTSIAGMKVATDDKANGYYLHFGYAVIPQLELDIRYDTLNRATETDAGERKFTTTTLGAQWFFDKKNRVTFNYEFRSAEAPNLPSSHNANKILDNMDNRLGVQITSIF